MIEITNYEKSSKGKITAFIDINIPTWGIVIRRISKVLNNGKVWYNMPTFSKDLADGSKKYMPYVQFTTNNVTFVEKMNEAVAAYETKHAQTINPVEEVMDDLPF